MWCNITRMKSLNFWVNHELRPNLSWKLLILETFGIQKLHFMIEMVIRISQEKENFVLVTLYGECFSIFIVMDSIYTFLTCEILGFFTLKFDSLLEIRKSVYFNFYIECYCFFLSFLKKLFSYFIVKCGFLIYR